MAAPIKEHKHSKRIRVVEFYSGVGGMHYAIEESGIPAEVVAAIDINDTANKVYRFNFPSINQLQRNIQSNTLKEFNKWAADMFLMSPPCQPFTRVGLKGDNSDPRIDSFFYILDVLPRLQKKPEYLLVENVKGFETSSTRKHLVEVLSGNGYSFEEFLISPTDFGLANQRLRYFLLAKLKPLNFTQNFCVNQRVNIRQFRINHESDNSSASQEQVNISRNTQREQEGFCNDEEVNHLRTNSEKEVDNKIEIKEGNWAQIEPVGGQGRDGCKMDRGEAMPASQGSRIKDYIEPLTDADVQRYLVPDKVLGRFWRVMDIQTENDHHTCCFTKAYGHYVEGTGSFLQTNLSVKKDDMLQDTGDPDLNLWKLKSLGLRYFTPREVANFHHFPPSFSFPDDVTWKQRYRVLGNSLNAHVVAVLVKYLVSNSKAH